MKNSQNKKKIQLALLVLIAVLTLSIGYAAITSIVLRINSIPKVSAVQENFKVYFTESTITEGKGTVSIDEDDATIGYFDITGLSKVGDYAESTYTVLNDSNGVGAEISLQLTNSNNEYFKVTETLEDTQLQAGEDTTVIVKVELTKTPIENNVSTSITAKLIASPIEDASATGNLSESTLRPLSQFDSDSWATIKSNVQNGNTSQYNVGDKKIIIINGNEYILRIANKTTGNHCSDEDTEYSQTACGFVIEFADIVTTMKMRDTDINSGGYPATLIYDYLNNTLYGQLPEDLQSAIKPTRVISSYECYGGWINLTSTCNNPGNNGTCYSTIDRLYLLSTIEIFGEEYDGDNSSNTSTQLDYYKEMELVESVCDWYPNCMASGYLKAVKQYNNKNFSFWLRSSSNSDNSYFYYVSSVGSAPRAFASTNMGVSPAFRIG